MELRVNVITGDHFKGFLHRELAMSASGDTVIVGDNKSGKTTIYDAYTWGWTGKDSLGRKEFGIKTKQDGEVLHNCDYKVTLQLTKDGEPLEVCRVMNEQWGRSNGAETDSLQGHETHYFINGIECRTKREFDAELANIVSEEDFRLLSDVTYFFQLKPEDQKRLLFSLENPVTDSEVADCEPSVGELLELLEGKSIEAYYKESKEKRNLLKKDLDAIPAKIAAKQEDMPEVEDWEALEREREVALKARKSVDDELADIASRESAVQKERLDIQKQIGEKRLAISTERNNLALAANNDRNTMLATIQDMKAEQGEKRRMIERHTATITERRKAIATHRANADRLEKEMEALRQDYYRIQAEVFTMPQAATVCPTCLRPLEPGELAAKEAELQMRFNEDKSNRLNAIRTDGASRKQKQATENQYIADYTAEIDELEEGIKTLSEGVATLDKQIAEMEKNVPEIAPATSNETIDRLDAEVNALLARLANLDAQGTDDTAKIKQRKAWADESISELDRRIAARDHYNRVNDGIVGLQEQQRAINKELAKADHIVDLIELFIKTKDQILIDRINSHFELCRFSFLSQRLNGKDNITCECTVNGVEYKDVNNAGRINAGLDVINAFCRAKDTYIPIFVDNAEGVQNILPTKSQKILLYVAQSNEHPSGTVFLPSNAVK